MRRGDTKWLSQFSETFVLPSRLFPLLNSTLASLPIADALDAFSTPYTKDGAEIDEDDDIEKRDYPSEIKVKVERVPYPLTRALDGLFMPQEEFERLLRIWRRKRNLVLQGSPGVGKSFVARRLAYALIGYEDPNRVQMIQFHQSYAYEDFVQGFRPTTDGKFVLRDGIFVDFCNKALADPGESYVLVIDEINRGNLSKILGELMLLIENDKRSAKWAVKLAYSDNDAPKFHVPENVYLLGKGGADAFAEGMLLYPCTDATKLRLDFILVGHRVRVCSVDLTCPWQTIHNEMIGLIAE